MTPRELKAALEMAHVPRRRLIDFGDRLGIKFHGTISGAYLAAVCGVDSRTWRHWDAGTARMPVSAWRLLVTVSGLNAPMEPGEGVKS